MKIVTMKKTTKKKKKENGKMKKKGGKIGKIKIKEIQKKRRENTSVKVLIKKQEDNKG